MFLISSSIGAGAASSATVLIVRHDGSHSFLIVQSPGYCLMGTMSGLLMYVGFANRRVAIVDPKLRYVVAGICRAIGEYAIAEW